MAPLALVAQPAGQAPGGASELGGVQDAVDGRGRGPAAAELEGRPARDLLGRPALPQDQPLDEGAPPLVVEEPGPAVRLPPRLVAPLRGGGAVEPRAGIAAEIAQDRRSAPAERTRDLPDRFPLAREAHDVLELLKAKMVVTARGRLPISICRRKQHRIRAP